MKNTGPTATGPRVCLPKNSIIQPALSGHIHLPILPSTATQNYAYPNLKNASLLSIRKLCYSNCSALFTKKDVIVFSSYKTPVLNGISNTYNGFWDVTIETSQPEPSLTATITQHTNSVIHLDKTKSELASYLHDVAGCPKTSPSIQVINNGSLLHGLVLLRNSSTNTYLFAFQLVKFI